MREYGDTRTEAGLRREARATDLVCPSDRWEIHSYGFDDAVAGIGSSPSAGYNGVGLRVPAKATATTSGRYLFQCASQMVSKSPVWLVGIRQLLTIGLDTNSGTPPIYALEQRVRGPWKFADGNVSWHLRFVKLAPGRFLTGNALNTHSFAWQWSDSPSLVYQTSGFPAVNLNAAGTPDNYLKLTSYSAPKLLGRDVGGWGTFWDVRFPWDDPSRQSIEPLRLRGPGFVVLYASVWQPSSTHTSTITVPAAMPLNPELAEEGFLAAWPKAQYWRVGGGMIFDTAREC